MNHDERRRHSFETAAERGTHRGADDVLGAAMIRAGAIRAGANPGGSTMSDEHLDDLDVLPTSIPAVELESNRPRRSNGRRGIAGLGIAALLGIGGYAGFALQGDGGGADSPAAAVEQLADAIASEDALAAIDVLAPGEVRSLHRSIENAADKAEQFDVVEEAGTPLAGFDIDVEGLETEVETLGDGVARVTITGGVVSGRVDPEAMGAEIAERAADGEASVAEGEFDFADRAELDTPVELIAIEEDGGWYVSPAYSIMELARAEWEQDHGPVAIDYGSADPAQLGAADPEAAVRDGVEALRTGDWERLTELAPPDEIPAWEYRELLLAAAADAEAEPDFDVADLTVDVDVDGSTAVASVTARGTGGDGTPWQVGGDCEAFYEEQGDEMYGGCVGATAEGFGLFGAFIGGGVASDDAASGAPIEIELVERDGRWFISPVGTVLRYVDAFIDEFDADTLAMWTNDYSDVEPDGAVTLGESIALEANAGPLVFTLDAEAGDELVGRAGSLDDDPYAVNVGISVYDPAGDEVWDAYGLAYGTPVTLEQSGTYRLVVWNYGPATELTIWDRADAPEGAEQDFGGGIDPTFGGQSTECTSTDATGDVMHCVVYDEEGNVVQEYDQINDSGTEVTVDFGDGSSATTVAVPEPAVAETMASPTTVSAAR
jgi:hypothetical protein